MSTIVTRAGKGSALTWTEGDANITNLNNDKLEHIVSDTTPQLGGNLDVNGQSIVSVSNGNIVLEPNGTGDVQLNADTVRIGDASGVTANLTVPGGCDLIVGTSSNSNITFNSGTNGNIEITPNGTGDVYLTADTVIVGDVNATATITTNGTGDLILNTNSGTNSGFINIINGANANIEITPNGSGDVNLNADTVRVGDANIAATLTTNGTGNLTISTNSGTNSGTIAINQGANSNISITPNGTGQTVVKNLEYQEFVHALGTTSGTIAPNATNGNVQTITLNGNLTINAFTSPVSGQTITLIITTGGTGRTLTSSMLFAGGSKTLSTTSTVDILTMSYIGTTYYASLVKGYA